MNTSSASVALMQSQVMGSLMNSSSSAKSEESWASVFSLMVSNGAPTVTLPSAQLPTPQLSAATLSFAQLPSAVLPFSALSSTTMSSEPASPIIPDSYVNPSSYANPGSYVNPDSYVNPSSYINPGSYVNPTSYTNPSGSVKGLSPTGRNMGLFDPESAYKMMTVINNSDVSYKAQFSELSQMKSYVFHMQDAAQRLGGIALSTGNDCIKSRLQNFVGEYNNWIQRFAPDIQQGGLLADTQAAQASRFELEQNVNNHFFGIKDGVHGLRDLGFTIDPGTHLAALDSVKLDSLLAANKQGVVDTVQEFGANFAKSASLLNADGNFILKQLDNLNRAIHYIADNKAALQQEFGTGKAAKPTGQVAQALLEYNHNCCA